MAEENKPIKQHVHNYIQLTDDQFNQLFGQRSAEPVAQVVQPQVVQPMDGMTQCVNAMASMAMPFMMMNMMRAFMH